MSWPIQEYDSFRVAAQETANATQNISTASEKIETSPTRGIFTVLLPQLLHLLLRNKQGRKQ